MTATTTQDLAMLDSAMEHHAAITFASICESHNVSPETLLDIMEGHDQQPLPMPEFSLRKLFGKLRRSK